MQWRAQAKAASHAASNTRLRSSQLPCPHKMDLEAQRMLQPSARTLPESWLASPFGPRKRKNCEVEIYAKMVSSRAQPGKFPEGFGAASRPPGACSASKEKRRRKGREDAQIARAFARFAREEEVTSEQDAVRSGAWRARSRSRDGLAQQPPQTLDKEVCLRSLTLQGGHFGGRCVARPPCQSAWRSVREHAASDVGSEMRHHV